MARTAAFALVLLAVMAGEAQATDYRVIAVPGASEYNLRSWESGGAAIGLLVPGAGPETSEHLARASLVQGTVANSLRGGVPTGKQVIELGGAPFGAPARVTILVGVPRGGEQPNDRRYPVAVFGRGYEGILVSETTRIPGIVSIADIAPTALGSKGALSSEPRGNPVGFLLDLDRRVDRNNSTRAPATLLLGALLVLLAVVFPRGSLLGVGTLLAANLLLGLVGVSTPWFVVAVLGLAVAAGGPLLALALRSPTAIGTAFGLVLVAYLAVLGVHGEAVSLSPLGPTQNSRFFGLSNLLETLLLVPALAGAAFLAVPLGWSGLLAVAALALITVAGDRFGADGGGAIVLGVGYAVLALLLSGARKRGALVALAVAAAIVVAFLALDAATGGTSHVSRALRGGPSGLAGDLADRVAISWQRTTAHWYVTVLVVAAVAIIAARVGLLLRRDDLPRERRALPFAFAAAVLTSLVVNDSPNDVCVTGLAGYLAVEAAMLRDPCARFFSSSRSPLSLSWAAAAARRPFPPRPRP